MGPTAGRPTPAPEHTTSSRRSVLSWAAGPGGQTLLLTLATAALGLASLSALPPAPLLPRAAAHGWVPVAVLFAALLVTELAQVHVEVRRQAYSFSLTAAPMALGLLFCPPDALVVARVGAAAAAFAVQRVRPDKASFNLAGYLLEACLLVHAGQVLAPAQPGLDLPTALAVLASLTLCELVATCLVLLVIRINTGPLRASETVESIATGMAFLAVNATCALAAAVLLTQGPLGWTLLALLAGLAYGVHRLHSVMRRRQASLELVKGFVELGAQTAADSGDLSAVLLERLRQVVRAERAEILVPADDAEGGWVVRQTCHESGAEPLSLRTGRREHDSVLADAAAATSPTLLRTESRDRREGRFLASHELQEAMLHPVELDGRRGLVLVADRLGETSSFGRHDLSLLQTLAGHLEVALRRAWLLAQLRHDATPDQHTGLANRPGLRERSEASTAECAGRPVAVLAVALDRHDEVKTVLGHHAGDELLVEVAQRLADAVPGATTARLGGEEFAVLLVPPPGTPPLVHALDVAGRVERAVASPVQLTSALVTTSAAIGVAVAEPGESTTDVLRRADTARSAAPPGSRGPVAYTASMDEGRAERVGLLADLHRAVEGDELELHYQPKLDLALGLVTSVESLVRWEHPRLGRLSPDVFVPLAESTALIEPFTHHLLGKALAQCRRWQDQGVDLSVAVNLSARNVLDPDLPGRVAAALAVAGVPASRLTLEMTESSMVEDPRRTTEVLQHLAALGVTISLDDFGTGYSSLSYLQQLPVRELKIDRSFVRGLEATATAEATAVSAALIRSITALKDALGLEVVAEGVEDLAVMERLRDLGCDVIQGYVISRPVPAGQLDGSVYRWRTTREATGL